MSRVKLVAVLLFAFAAGAVAIANGCYRLYQLAKIGNGPAVEARATDWDTRPRRWHTDYRVKYVFEADGATCTGGPVAVPKDVYESTRNAPALTVRYAPDRPDWHLPEAALAAEKDRAAFIALPGLFVCAFVVVGSALAWYGARLKAKGPQSSHHGGA